jgi:hypothetical protein
MLRFKIHLCIILAIVFGWGSHLFPQSGKDVGQQIWIDVNPAYQINPTLRLYGDVGMRKEIGNNGWWRLVFRPTFRIKLGGIFYYTSGIGNFFTFNQIIDNRWEFRPFQGLTFKWPNWKIPLNHYFRLEERFDFNTNSWDSKNSLRFRYKLSLSYRWAARRQKYRYWQATLGAEAFATLTGQQGQFQEQTRVTIGLDRSMRRDLHFRFELTWQKEDIFFLTGDNVSNLYFRFRYTKSWGG